MENELYSNVSLSEFYKLRKGMTITEVNRIVGTTNSMIITGVYRPEYYLIDENDGLSAKITLDFFYPNNTLSSVTITKNFITKDLI